MEFQGSLVALITPFTEDDRIDVKALVRLVEWHIEKKTDGLVLLGTTGESWAISSEERILVTTTAVNASKGRIPIIIGVGSADTRTAVRYSEIAKSLGADGFLVVTPYYNRPTQEGCLAHFKEIAKVGLPMIIYHHPKRTGCFLELSTLEVLAKIKEVIAIKDAYGDLDYMRQTPLPVLSGDDLLSLKWYELGACGTISVIGNIIPDVWSQIANLCFIKNYKQAKELFDQCLPLMESLLLEPNPQCVKYGLFEMGKCKSRIRLPLLLPRAETQRKIKACVMSKDKILSCR